MKDDLQKAKCVSQLLGIKYVVQYIKNTAHGELLSRLELDSRSLVDVAVLDADGGKGRG